MKAKLPRRESERRNHPLARHVDILSAIETRLSLLSMTYSKYIDLGLCCFIPGKVIVQLSPCGIWYLWDCCWQFIFGDYLLLFSVVLHCMQMMLSLCHSILRSMTIVHLFSFFIQQLYCLWPTQIWLRFPTISQQSLFCCSGFFSRAGCLFCFPAKCQSICWEGTVVER